MDIANFRFYLKTYKKPIIKPLYKSVSIENEFRFIPFR